MSKQKFKEHRNNHVEKADEDASKDVTVTAKKSHKQDSSLPQQQKCEWCGCNEDYYRHDINNKRYTHNFVPVSDNQQQINNINKFLAKKDLWVEYLLWLGDNNIPVSREVKGQVVTANKVSQPPVTSDKQDRIQEDIDKELERQGDLGDSLNEYSDNQDKFKTYYDIQRELTYNCESKADALEVIDKQWISREDHEKEIRHLQERINDLVNNCSALETNKNAYKQECEELKDLLKDSFNA